MQCALMVQGGRLVFIRAVGQLLCELTALLSCQLTRWQEMSLLVLFHRHSLPTGTKLHKRRRSHLLRAAGAAEGGRCEKAAGVDSRGCVVVVAAPDQNL